MKSSIIKQCFFVGFFIALSCESIYPMFSWFSSGQQAQQPQPQVWVKTKSAQESQQPTSAVLDAHIKAERYSEALELFNIVLAQKNQTKYAIRWAKSVAEKGIFPIQYQLIKYYQRLLLEGIVGLNIEEVNFVCGLIIKSNIMMTMACNWFEYKSNIAMKNKCKALLAFLNQEYARLLNNLLGRYSPSYSDIHEQVVAWINKNLYSLTRVLPNFLLAMEMSRDALVFSSAHSNASGFVHEAVEKIELQKINETFLKALKKHQSWDEFYRNFNVNA